MLLAFILTVAPIYAAVANDIDQNALNHPMFDDRMEAVQITIRAGAEMYKWVESREAVDRVTETVKGRIIGRYLFPSNYTNERIVWWYYVAYTARNQNQYHWMRDIDFSFDDGPLKTGVYAFQWIPKNEVFHSLGEEKTRVLIRSTAGQEFELLFGRLESDGFHAHGSAVSGEAHSDNYLKFVFLNCFILFPRVSSRVIPFIYIRNPYEGVPNVPELHREQDAGPLFLDELISGYGRVNGSYVRIRRQPNTDTVYQQERLMENQIVEILDRTDTEDKIGDMSAVWYKIRTATGVVGWAYGWYIDEEVRYLLQP
jgi:hypothetical protein